MYIGPYIQQNDQPVYYHWKPHHAISTADLPPPNPTARSSDLGDIVPEATLAPHCDWCSAGERVVGVPLRGTEGAENALLARFCFASVLYLSSAKSSRALISDIGDDETCPPILISSGNMFSILSPSLSIACF